MPTMFILAVAAMELVLVQLAVIVVIRQEPSTHELTRQVPRPIAKFA
jgi:hypothetical protein